MVVSCWVKGCSNRADGTLSFHYIPKVRECEGEKTREISKERRRVWLANINRKDEPSKTSRICSDHFVSGKPAELYDQSNPDWAPTLNLSDTLTLRKSAKKINKTETDLKRMPRLIRKSVLQPRKWTRKETLKTASTPISDSSLKMEKDPHKLEIFELPQNIYIDIACADFGTQTKRCQTDFGIQTEESVTEIASQTLDSANFDHSYCVNNDIHVSSVGNLSNTRMDDCYNEKLSCGFLGNSYECDSIAEQDETPSDSLSTVFLDISSTEQVVETLSFEMFCCELQKHLSPGYQFLKKTSKVLLFQTYSEESVTVKLVVTIYEDFTSSLTVHNKDIPRSHEIWDSLPFYFHNTDSVSELCSRIEKYHVCAGNPDKDFTSLVPVGGGLTSNLQETMAYHEANFDASSKNTTIYHGTIRTINCALLVRGERCKNCMDYRKCLKRRKTRILEREGSNRTFLHTTFKHTDMTRANLLKKLSEQKYEINSLQKKVWQLQREMKKIISKEGVELSPYENLKLKDLMKSCEKEFEKSFPDQHLTENF